MTEKKEKRQATEEKDCIPFACDFSFVTLFYVLIHKILFRAVLDSQQN